VSLSTSHGIWTGEGTSDELGYEVAGVGDVNGDGVPDFAAGAPDNTTRNFAGGAAYIFFGGVSGTHTASSASARIYGTTPLGVGWAVAGAGDTDGDGLDDVLVGALYGGASKVALFLGPPTTGYFSSADATMSESGTYLGGAANTMTSAGDVDGDGYDDVWLSAIATSSNAGAVYLLRGPLAGSVDLSLEATATISGSSANLILGQGLARIPDVDGDGDDEVLVGATGSSRYGRYTGAAYLYYGPLVGTFDEGDADATFYGNNAEEFMGASLAGGQDLTGDGFPDLLMGAYYGTGDASTAGSAWVRYGEGL
jgi:hypothetical protein